MESSTNMTAFGYDSETRDYWAGYPPPDLCGLFPTENHLMDPPQIEEQNGAFQSSNSHQHQSRQNQFNFDSHYPGLGADGASDNFLRQIADEAINVGEPSSRAAIPDTEKGLDHGNVNGANDQFIDPLLDQYTSNDNTAGNQSSENFDENPSGTGREHANLEMTPSANLTGDSEGADSSVASNQLKQKGKETTLAVGLQLSPERVPDGGEGREVQDPANMDSPPQLHETVQQQPQQQVDDSYSDGNTTYLANNAPKPHQLQHLVYPGNNRNPYLGSNLHMQNNNVGLAGSYQSMSYVNGGASPGYQQYYPSRPRFTLPLGSSLSPFLRNNIGNFSVNYSRPLGVDFIHEQLNLLYCLQGTYGGSLSEEQLAHDFRLLWWYRWDHPRYIPFTGAQTSGYTWEAKHVIPWHFPINNSLQPPPIFPSAVSIGAQRVYAQMQRDGRAMLPVNGVSGYVPVTPMMRRPATQPPNSSMVAQPIRNKPVLNNNEIQNTSNLVAESTRGEAVGQANEDKCEVGSSKRVKREHADFGSEENTSDTQQQQNAVATSSSVLDVSTSSSGVFLDSTIETEVATPSRHTPPDPTENLQRVQRTSRGTQVSKDQSAQSQLQNPYIPTDQRLNGAQNLAKPTSLTLPRSGMTISTTRLGFNLPNFPTSTAVHSSSNEVLRGCL